MPSMEIAPIEVPAIQSGSMPNWWSAHIPRLSRLVLPAIQIDGLHTRDELTLVAAAGIDSADSRVDTLLLYAPCYDFSHLAVLKRRRADVRAAVFWL